MYKTVYLGVYCYMTPQGQVIPQRIRWENGQEWEIDRVLDSGRNCARRVGGAGLRYRVRIGQHERELYWVDGRWFTQVACAESA